MSSNLTTRKCYKFISVLVWSIKLSFSRKSVHWKATALQHLSLQNMALPVFQFFRFFFSSQFLVTKSNQSHSGFDKNWEAKYSRYFKQSEPVEIINNVRQWLSSSVTGLNMTYNRLLPLRIYFNIQTELTDRNN